MKAFEIEVRSSEKEFELVRESFLAPPLAGIPARPIRKSRRLCSLHFLILSVDPRFIAGNEKMNESINRFNRDSQMALFSSRSCSL